MRLVLRSTTLLAAIGAAGALASSGLAETPACNNYVFTCTTHSSQINNAAPPPVRRSVTVESKAIQNTDRKLKLGGSEYFRVTYQLNVRKPVDGTYTFKRNTLASLAAIGALLTRERYFPTVNDDNGKLYPITGVVNEKLIDIKFQVPAEDFGAAPVRWLNLKVSVKVGGALVTAVSHRFQIAKP